MAQHFVSSDYWFESTQNWQSEFLSVAALVVLSIYLRQRGSSQSKPVAEFSGGWRMRLNLAQALVSRCDLMLLDEPSFGLAPLVVQEIFRILRRINEDEKVSMLIVEQNVTNSGSDIGFLAETAGAAREVLSKEGNFIRPMYTPGFAAPEMYRRDSSMGPWTDIYAIGACIYACMQGYPPNDAPQRLEKDRLSLALSRLRGVYSDNLIEVVEWCMSLDPLSRPQSVFALQKELSRETERSYTKLTVAEKMRLQFDNIVSDNKKSLRKSTNAATKFR